MFCIYIYILIVCRCVFILNYSVLIWIYLTTRIDCSILWHETGWMARLSSSKKFLRLVVSHHRETCTHGKSWIFLLRGINEWMTEWMDNSPTGSKLLISMNVKLQTTFTFSLVALVTVRHCAGWAATTAAAIQPHVSSRPVVLVAGKSFCPQAVLRPGRQKQVSPLHSTSYPSVGWNGGSRCQLITCAPYNLPQRGNCAALVSSSVNSPLVQRDHKSMVNL